MAHLFGFQALLTIVMAFRRIRFNCAISKHGHIFLSIAPINKLMLLFSSLTRKDHFRSIERFGKHSTNAGN